MEDALVSVIMPVYNREDTIKRAIDSILFQTYSKIELIIVDDVSTDHSVEMISAYNDGRIRLICLNEHGGAGKARNIGIAHSRGEYIAFQDSDDEWLPDKLMIQMNYMKDNAFDVCYSSYYNHIGNKVVIVPEDQENKERYEKNIRETLKEVNTIGTPTLVVNRKVLSRLQEKGFDERLPRFQDYDLAIRLAQTASIAYIETPLVHAYRSSNSISRNTVLLYDAIAILMEKHRGFLDTKTLFMDIIAHLQRLHLLLMRQYENVIEHIEDKTFAIYGAGKIGKEIYQRLLERDVRPSCFLVTEKGNEKYIDNIPVYSLDEYHNNQQMIIVGVGEGLQNELVDNLIQRGFLFFCVYQREK